ncbi:bifunctional ornithine acetyltransferase/N-acetylglutamate synthase [Amycolatopsis arida]|uniref:bifunctional ornithine acetyltransferase/N-acetylglutamate synthase n=1 Tax=Amycolatopsis arida TaxID=587909 RepID=UPI002445153C|nr:bifunctional ornithine acetyltransferase/N-acetylglutamate synthase [Amycolatopsis arida]
MGRGAHRARSATGATRHARANPSEVALGTLAEYLRGPEVVIEIDLGIADGSFTVYGCDLTEGYVRLNSAYTT